MKFDLTTCSARRFGLVAAWLFWAFAGASGMAAESGDRSIGSASDAREAPGEGLSMAQNQLADRYDRLEQIITRLAELTAASDPHRAKLLREALVQARERDVAVRFDAVVDLLQDGRLATAAGNQEALVADLQAMLQMLLQENRGDALAKQKERIRNQLKEIGRIIRLQRGVKARTEGGDDASQLSEDQARIADRTEQLADTMEASEDPGQAQGEEAGDGPAEGSSDSESSQPLQQRIRTAQQNMERAQQRLAEAEREGAASDQERALRELEQAKAELERILRQLRDEEIERALALLEVRFRKMLDMQLAVHEGTVRLDQVPPERRNHDDEIDAGRLSRNEAAIVLEADQVLLLLREEGTSVAFPEAVAQIRDDMQQIVHRLVRMQVGAITQGLEQDVIEALQEAIAAVRKALADLEQNRIPPGESAPPGAAQDPPLVDPLGELKMIRALQARVQRRTERYAQMIAGEQADRAEIMDALARLAERQERIEKATRDLHTGRNR